MMLVRCKDKFVTRNISDIDISLRSKFMNNILCHNFVLMDTTILGEDLIFY